MHVYDVRTAPMKGFGSFIDAALSDEPLFSYTIKDIMLRAIIMLCKITHIPCMPNNERVRDRRNRIYSM